MEQLKTLKDFDFRNKYIDDTPLQDSLDERKDELKAEAIKWIKELETANKENKDFCIDGCGFVEGFVHWENNREHQKITTQDPDESYGLKQCILWIKHFFDIEEEDLK